MSKHIRNRERAHIHAYVPSLFIVVMVAALIFDAFFPMQIFTASWALYVGCLLVFAGSILLYAAHISAKEIRKDIHLSDDNVVDFFVGPYKYMRHPGYTGMVLVGVGLSFVINSLIIFISAVVFYIIARVAVTREEEHMLHVDSHLRHHYDAYAKKVKRFF